MNCKLIAMDLDGTLNNDQKIIDAPTRDALMAAQARGIRLLLASARPLPGLFKERDALALVDHGGILMAYNGGLIQEARTGRVLASTAMDMEQAGDILRQLKRLPVTPILDDGRIFRVEDADGYMVQYECWNNRMTCSVVADLAEALDFAPCKILMSVQPEQLKAVQRTIADLLPDDLTVVQTAPFYLEVLPRSINKGAGLQAACRALGIDIRDTLAFGDSENDIEMLRAAGVGVAMGNAGEDVKAAADRVTRSNNENGIAAALAELGIPG